MMHHVATLFISGAPEAFYDVLSKDGKFFAVLTGIEETGITQGGMECGTFAAARDKIMEWARADYRHVLGNHYPSIHGGQYPVLRLA